MSTINKVVLLGNVGTVEVKDFETGKKLVQISLATSDGYKKNGEWVDKTEWHRCIFAIPQLAERAASIEKGDKIYLEGSINTQSWTTEDGGRKETREMSCTMVKTFSKAASKGEQTKSSPAPKKSNSNEDIPF